MNKTNTSRNLYGIARKFIPGGSQLFSKRAESFLAKNWPAYYTKARGCEIWDLDNKKYIDMSLMGMGSCVLGYADADVDAAVIDAVKSGSMCTLNVPEEVKLAELLIKIHPWAQMVRYARTGGEAMAVAIRIARAASCKDGVLCCGYHGWHDWYMSAYLSAKKSANNPLMQNMGFAGIPRKLMGTSFAFRFNDTQGFLRELNKRRNQIGAVVLEVVRGQYPEKEFIRTVRKVTRDRGVVLIVDEITSGFRFNVGGAHLLFELKPDIAVFSKAMSNGFPMAAIIGKKNVMMAAEKSFISSTYWTEKIGPVAALATIKKMQERRVSGYLARIGKSVQEGWKSLSLSYGIRLEVSGTYPLCYFRFLHENEYSLKRFFTEYMLKQGFLATNTFYASYAHKTEHINGYLIAVGKAFSRLRRKIP